MGGGGGGGGRAQEGEGSEWAVGLVFPSGRHVTLSCCIDAFMGNMHKGNDGDDQKNVVITVIVSKAAAHLVDGRLPVPA